jgi:hypothetical protein
MTATTKKKAAAAPTLAEKLNAIIAENETHLRARLHANGDVLAAEATDALTEFRRVALALRDAVLAPLPPASVVDPEDRDEMVLGYAAETLAKASQVAFAGAEARAGRALTFAREQWKSHLKLMATRQHWAEVHARQMQGGR